MRVLACVLMMAMVALAGCASDKETSPESPDAQNVNETPESGGAGAGTDGSSGKTPATGGATELGPSIVATIANGTAPLLVNFTLNATGASETMEWNVTFGDGNMTDGVGLPATVSHTYEAAGNMTVTFTVAQGDQTATATTYVAVATAEVVAPAGPEPGTEVSEWKVDFSGTIVMGSEIPFVRGCGVDSNSANDHAFDVPAMVEGVNVLVSKVVMDMDFGATNFDSDIWVYDSGAALVGESTDWNYAPGALGGSGSGTEKFTVEGLWPPGGWSAHVGSCVAAQGTYDVSMVLTLVAA